MTAQETSVLAAPRHGFAEVGAIRIHYLDFGGDGRPVVCLPGVGSHAWAFSGLARELGPGLRLLAVDPRGHGDSQWSASANYATTDLADDVAGLLRDLGLGPVAIVGASWGGLVGLAIASSQADLVDRLAMLDLPPSSTKSSTDVPPRPDGFDRHGDVVGWEQSNVPAAGEETIDTLARFGYRPGEAGRLVRKTDPFFLRRWPFRDEDWWPALERVRQPTLVVRAENGFLSAADAERMVAALPDGRTAVVGTSHYIHLDHAGELAALLREFLGR